jgi:hypothetical protein
VIINGVAVAVTASAEIDAIAAGQVRMVLLDAGSQEQVTVVMAGHSVLVQAHAGRTGRTRKARDEHGTG